MPLPEINFHQMRGKAPSGSRRDAFEELSSQLMIYGGLVTWPSGTAFTSFGNPDGGREGRAELPNGQVWCWQAKYLFGLGDDEFQQIDKSVRRAITTEPNLARYYIILPYNRPGGDTDKTTSAWTKWKSHVKRWVAVAAKKGCRVTFEYVGETELVECLIKPSQVGRLRYWFDVDGFSDERFREIAARAKADAGSRYTPELNVGLPIAEIFDGLARTPAFQNEIRTRLAELRRAPGTFGLSVPEQEPDLFRPAVERVQRWLDELDRAVTEAILRARQPTVELPDLDHPVTGLQEAIDNVHDLLQNHCLRDHYYVGNAGSLYSEIRKAQSAVRELTQLTLGRAWQSFGHRAVLITGTGGSGKTHLLCDLAEKRNEAGLPTLIALGEQFERGPIEFDLSRIVRFTGDPSELLSTFDVACQTAGEIGLIVIDAVNEAADRTLWRRHLGGFLNDVAQHSHLRLVLSCRSEFLTDTLAGDLQERMLAFPHTGFEEVTRDAIRQFLDWYGIERPSFPLLDPEFTNPFFLKLLCTALQQRSERRFPRTGIGATWIYDTFLDAMDDRLGAADRCDYDPASHRVRRAVELVAKAMYTSGRRLPRAEVDEITSALLPNRRWSSSLLNGLLKEGILSEFPHDSGSYVRFGYERLGDIALARLVASKTLPEVKVESIKMARRWHANSGVLQALASVLPEVHGTELVDLVEIRPTEMHYPAYADFLLSLAWRQASAVTDRSVEILLKLQDNQTLTDTANNTLLQVAAVPGHPLNAEWLHRHLAGIPLPDRDSTWGHFCDQQDEVDGHLPILIEWAWSDASSEATPQVRYLVALALAWALSSSHRPTRDNSTKAITALLERSPATLQQLLRDFCGVDDYYIEERLLAVGCGIAQRSLSAETVIITAEAVHDFTLGRDYWPENLLSRDYTRRVLETALARGWNPGTDDLAARIRPPYASTWRQECRSAAEVEALSGPPDYLYSAVSHPVTSDFDDFHKYAIRSAVRSFDLQGEIDTDHIGRLLFDRALELGWTPERFGSIDQNRKTAWGERRYEGYAQKYIWIAFKELLGRMTDRYAVDPRWRDDDRAHYEAPLDVYGHDLDPTMLLRRTEILTYQDTPKTWFAPVEGTFPEHLDADWPNNDEHSPQVDRLLVATDRSRTVWVVLEGEYQWSQTQAPEDAAIGKPRHRIWAQVRSYLIDIADLESWSQWAKGKNWYGRWMPESGSPAGLLLADHPYKSDWPILEERDGQYYDEEPPPSTPVVTTTRYGGVANDLDQSDSKHLYAFVPSTAFCKFMRLQRLADFRWGVSGKVHAENFSTREPGPDTVHVTIEALGEALRSEGRCVIWTVLAAKETVSERHDWPVDGEPVFRTYSASYVFDGTEIRLLDGNARTLHARGGVSKIASWSLLARLATG